MGTMSFKNLYNEYLELLNYDDRFEFTPPGLSFHGLIMGNPYIDIEGTATLKDMKKPNEKYAVINFHKRGWTANSYFNVDG